MLDSKLAKGSGDGFRFHPMPSWLRRMVEVDGAEDLRSLMALLQYALAILKGCLILEFKMN